MVLWIETFRATNFHLSMPKNYREGTIYSAHLGILYTAQFCHVVRKREHGRQRNNQRGILLICQSVATIAAMLHVALPSH